MFVDLRKTTERDGAGTKSGKAKVSKLGRFGGPNMGLSPVLVSMWDTGFHRSQYLGCRSQYLGCREASHSGLYEMSQDGALGVGTCRRPACKDSAFARVMGPDGNITEGT